MARCQLHEYTLVGSSPAIRGTPLPYADRCINDGDCHNFARFGTRYRERSSGTASLGCRALIAQLRGDGVCDHWLNSIEFEFDGGDCEPARAPAAAQTATYNERYPLCSWLDRSRVQTCPPGYSGYDCTLTLRTTSGSNCVDYLSTFWSVFESMQIYKAANRDRAYRAAHRRGTLIVGGGMARYGHDWPQRLAGVAPEPVVVRGIGGISISDIVFAFAELVRPLRPRVLVVMGWSDLTRRADEQHITQESWRASVRALVRLCAADGEWEGARLLVMGMKPYPPGTNNTKGRPSPNRLDGPGWAAGGRYSRANEWLAAQHAKGTLTFGAWGSPIARELRRGSRKRHAALFLSDGMHLRDPGYDLLTPVLREAVALCARRPLPDKPRRMDAFGKTAALVQPAFGDFAVPALGSLHTRYDVPANATCEVLLSVRASSVNPSDVSAVRGHRDRRGRLHQYIGHHDFPKVLGSDVAGIVTGTTEGCTRLKVGDRVWGDIGATTWGPDGGRTKQLGSYGSFAVALEAQLATIPRALSFSQAGVLPKVALTTFKAFSWFAGAPTDARWTRDDSAVLVLGGSGGCGSVGIQMAKAFGAKKVITTCSAANSHYCRALGADQLIDHHSQDWWAVLGDGTVDVVYDTVGQDGTGERAMTKLRDGGFYVTITGATAASVPVGRGQVMLTNSNTNMASAPALEAMNALIDSGKWDAGAVAIDSTYSLKDTAEAMARSRTGRVVGKVSIVVQATDA